MDTSRQNTASQILDKLTNDILQGVYLPNDKLQIKTLKDRYNVGTSPLREALSQLIAKDFDIESIFHIVIAVFEKVLGNYILTPTHHGMRNDDFAIHPYQCFQI